MVEAVSISVFQNTTHRKSKMGYEFFDSDVTWRLDNSINLNWGRLPKKVNETFVNGYKKQMADYAEELSASTCDIIFEHILSILRTQEASELSLSVLQNYLSTLDNESEWKLGSIRAFLLNWIDKKIEGISPKIESWLEQITLKGINKGVPVAKGCPHTGAYSMQEQEAILRWGVNAFIDDKLSLHDYTWLMLNIYLGARPTQFCQLQAGDLRVKSREGSTEYTLLLPHAKKRGVKNFRDYFKEVDIDEDLALLISNQAQATVKLIEKQVGTLTDRQKAEMPVFGAINRIRGLSSKEELENLRLNTPDILHFPRGNADKILRNLTTICDARSDRLKGEFIHLTARRFRYTLGTNAARRGLTPFVIAKILGHSDIQNVKVYTENVKELGEEINEALAGVLAPLAQAFAGTLISSEADAIRVNDPLSRIHNSHGDSLGNCGKYGFCSTGGRACYTCAKFQPWVHGRHQVFLNDLLEERKRLRDKGASSFVLQSTDRVMLAIQEVIILCEKAKRDEGLLDG